MRRSRGVSGPFPLSTICRMPRADDLRALLRSVALAGRDIATAPSRWRARDWALLCAFLVATVIAYREKWPMQSLLQGTGGSVAHALAELADVPGSDLAMVSYGVAAFVVGRCAKKRALVDAAIALGAGGAWCWALTKAGQLVLAESRPIEGGAMHWMALGGHGVSGHAAAAALLFWTARDALETNVRGPLRRAAEFGLLAWAILVCWSRVHLGEHFVWNVMLGFAVGTFTGRRRNPVTRTES